MVPEVPNDIHTVRFDASESEASVLKEGNSPRKDGLLCWVCFSSSSGFSEQSDPPAGGFRLADRISVLFDEILCSSRIDSKVKLGADTIMSEETLGLSIEYQRTTPSTGFAEFRWS